MTIIVGAGIAGLSLGWELLKRGEDVTLVEANTVASGASGVATSYLEPRLGSTTVRQIEWNALGAWPQWASDLEQDSGMSVDLRRDGQIRIGLAADIEKFRKDLNQRAEQGWSFERLTPEQILKLEPSLTREAVEGAFLPDVAWVDGQKVCVALALAIERRGGKILTHWPMSKIETSPGSVSVINARGELLTDHKLVLANARGCDAILGRPGDIGKSRPVRGVNLVLDSTSLKHPIRHHIKHNRGNICPRGEGKLLVGTTYEPEETSLKADAETIEKLYRNVEPILPCVRQLPLLRVDCGLRSKIGDGNLLVGRSSELPEVYFSLSHAGAGFLRAPFVAKELACLVLETAPDRNSIF